MDSITRPPYGSIESYVQILLRGRAEFLETRALGIVQMIAEDPDIEVGVKVERIRNVVHAVEQIERSAAVKPDTSGLGYSRPAEEPQPAGQRRVPSHFQHATDEGVDELPPTPAPTRVVHLSLRGDTACEKTVSSLPAGHGHSTEHADVTCKECLEAVPF